MRLARRSSYLVVACAMTCGGCAQPKRSATPVGVSNVAAGAVAAAPSSTTRAVPAASIPLDYEKRFVRIRPLEPSEGHAPGRFVSEVYANAMAADALTNEAPFPPGSLFIERHGERRGDGGKGPTFTMEKTIETTPGSGGGWRFAAFDSRDREVGASGGPGLHACAQCHRDAARDYVFLPAAALTPPASALR
jgi:Cytochrome P460